MIGKYLAFLSVKMASMIKTILAFPLLLIVIALVLGLFFGTPLCAIFETVDILRMRCTAVATVTKVEVVAGSEGGSRPQVTYAYSVGGVNYAGDRYAPGWFANEGSWTGGGRGLRQRYWPGKVVSIHYRAANPAHCCLEYGWFKWSIGFSLAVWGGVLARKNCNIFRRAVAQSMIFGGAGLIFIGPDVIHVDKVYQFVAYYLGIVAACLLYLLFQRHRGERAAGIEELPGHNQDVAGDRRAL